ncbi:hypothetical protein SAMN05444004_12018 [Jannaschia faecimaris]|uniref:Sulfotransferase family protein n=1 Tax=Jannaschia faecimaris TaxID=1244108 RepID=A0A1H3TVK7_9RHOB|nr:hypothetical protein [Jannaschia faecimaris]SDZ54250.1 hypothetical protein SAMN05444004_12018 [Jannaschia faecimaris]
MKVVNRALKRRLGGYVMEAQSILRSLRHPRTAPERRFVLFGRGRSGSTLMVQMLDANPEIGCLDEILRFSTLMPVRMIERELGRIDKPVRGFKLLSYQIRELHGRHSGPLRCWMADPAVKIFHLRRDNVLRHALSNIYAGSRRAYHSTDSSATEVTRITIAADDMFRWMRGSLDLLAWEQRYLGDMDREEICYERDLSSPTVQAATLDRVSRALDVYPVKVQAPLRKVTPKDYDAFIENWPALRKAIAASEFSSYLDRSD